MLFFALIGALALLASCGSSGTSSAGAASGSQAPSVTSNTAAALCESMVAGEVQNLLGDGHVIGKPVKTKSGDRTTCTYHSTAGNLVVSVNESKTDSDALVYFDNAKHDAGKTVPIKGLGAAAYSQPDGTTVTIKDNKVLTVDPTQLNKLAAATQHTQIAQGLSFGVLNCWSG